MMKMHAIRLHPRLLLGTGLVLSAVFLLACEKEKVIEKSPRSNVAVELPKKPTLTPPKYVKQHSDGVWTVEGLLRNNKEVMGKTVRVRGKIVELTRCPPPKPYTQEEIDKFNKLHDKWKKLVRLAKKIKKIPPEEPVLAPKKQARTCNPRPKAMLMDEPANDRFQLIVAGSMYSPLKDFKDTQTVTIEGLFDMVTPDGHYMSQDGLIHLKDLPEPEDDDVQEAPGEAPPDKKGK